MIVFGGFIRGSRTNQVWQYEFEANKWNKLSDDEDKAAPEGRNGHDAAVVNDQLIMFGGCNEDNDKLNDLWIFNLQSKKWEEVKEQEGDGRPSVSGSEV